MVKNGILRWLQKRMFCPTVPARAKNFQIFVFHSQPCGLYDCKKHQCYLLEYSNNSKCWVLQITMNFSAPFSSCSIFLWMPEISRNSRPEVFCKKCVLRNFSWFTGKHLCQSLFLNKVEHLLLQNTSVGCFSKVNFRVLFGSLKHQNHLHEPKVFLRRKIWYFDKTFIMKLLNKLLSSLEFNFKISLWNLVKT